MKIDLSERLQPFFQDQYKAMNTTLLFIKHIGEGVSSTFVFSKYVTTALVKEISKKKEKTIKIRDIRELDLLKQTHDAFEELLSKNLSLPIR